LEANLTACTLLGLARGKVAASSLVGQPFFLFIQKEDSNVFRLIQKRIFETGEPQACDVRMVKPDGTPFWAHLKAAVAQEAVGAPVCRITLSDITERKQVERELLERQKKLQCLYDISALKLLPDISFPVLMERITELIPPAWQFPEVTAARITLGNDIFQTKTFRVTPWIQTREIVVNGHPAGLVEVCYLEERPASDEGPFLIQERNLVDTIAVQIGSICARHQAEEALAFTAKRLALATRAGGVGIWDYDVVNNRLVWDDQMYCLYGITPTSFGGVHESWKGDCTRKTSSESAKQSSWRSAAKRSSTLNFG
jgi:PAS domain S-box-containing protein